MSAGKYNFTIEQGAKFSQGFHLEERGQDPDQHQRVFLPDDGQAQAR